MPRQMSSHPPFPDITRPYYLLEIVFPGGGIMRMNNTDQDIDVVAGNPTPDTFYAHSFTVTGMNTRVVGRTEASVRIENVDQLIGVRLLVRGADRVKAKLWLDYAHWGPGAPPPYLMISGHADGVRIGDAVDMNLISSTLHNGGAPRLTFGPPFMNWIPGSDFHIRWNNEFYRLVRR